MSILVEHNPCAFRVSDERYNLVKDKPLPMEDEFLIQLIAVQKITNHYYEDDSLQATQTQGREGYEKSFKFPRQVFSRKEDANQQIVNILSTLNTLSPVTILDPLSIPSQLIQGVYDIANFVAEKTYGRKVVVWIEFSTIQYHNYDQRLDEVLALSSLAAVPLTVPATQSSIQALEKVRLQMAETCAVCLEEMLIGSEANRMPCSHVFHQQCIFQWLQLSHLCPLCRFKMPTI